MTHVRCLSVSLLMGSLLACSPGYRIGPTTVVLDPAVDHDPQLDENLLRLQQVTTKVYGTSFSEEVFDVDLRVFPASHEIWIIDASKNRVLSACATLYHQNAVEVRVDTQDCLAHEFWEHRLTKVIADDWNENHSEPWLKNRKRLEMVDLDITPTSKLALSSR